MHFGHLLFWVELFVNNIKDFVSDCPIVNIPNSVCETCEIGNKHEVSFPTKMSWKAKRLL